MGLAALAWLLFAQDSLPQRLEARVAGTTLEPGLKDAVQSAVLAGKLADAEQVLVQELNRKPLSPEVLALSALLFLADNQALNAAIALKKLEKIRPLTTDERFTLAMAYTALKRTKWARSELDQLAKQFPSKALYPYWLARLSYDDAKYEDAEHLMRHVIELEPSFARAYDNLGLNLEAQGRVDEALAAYVIAMDLDQKGEKSGWPALNYGTLALRIGNLNQAKSALDTAANLAPGSAQAHYRLGVWNEVSGNSPQSIRELQTSTRLDPHYAEPWWALARLLRRDGDIPGADAALAQFKKVKNLKQ